MDNEDRMTELLRKERWSKDDYEDAMMLIDNASNPEVTITHEDFLRGIIPYLLSNDSIRKLCRSNEDYKQGVWESLVAVDKFLFDTED